MKKIVILLTLCLSLNIAAQEPTTEQKKEIEEPLKKEQKKAHEAFLKELEAKRDMLEKILPVYRTECENISPHRMGEDRYKALPYLPICHGAGLWFRNNKICLQYCKLSQEYLDTLDKIEKLKEHPESPSSINLWTKFSNALCR